MNIFGQLKDAQLEITESDPTKKGQITYKDSTGRVQLNNGSVKQLALLDEITPPTQAALDLKADTSSLGDVATSNDYNDLDNLPVNPFSLETFSTAGAATIAATTTHVNADATSGDVDLTLPSPVLGKEIVVNRTDGSGVNRVTVLQSGLEKGALYGGNDSITLGNDGTTWRIKAERLDKHYIEFYRNNTIAINILSTPTVLSPMNIRSRFGVKEGAFLGRAEVGKSSIYNFTAQVLFENSTWASGTIGYCSLYIDGVEEARGSLTQSKVSGSELKSVLLNLNGLFIQRGSQVEVRAFQNQTGAGIEVYQGSGQELYTRWEMVEA